MKNVDLKKFAFEFLVITVGVFFISFAITSFFEPNDLVTGGFSGFAIAFDTFAKNNFGFSVPVWFTNIALNVPLFIAALKTNGLKFLAKTLYATFLLSFFLILTSYLPQIKTDLFLSSIYGGVISGIGLGLCLRGFATTGGTDLLAFILNRINPNLSVSKLIFYFDSIIISFGIYIFGFEKAMYAIISVFVTSKVMENILEGINFSKAVFIISKHSEEISKGIIKEMDRGVTGLFGKGMYNQEENTVLLTVVSIKEIASVKDIVKKIDQNSFIIVADVREVLGEGFGSFV